MVVRNLLAGSLAFALLGAQAQQTTPEQLLAEQSIPDAPKPQATLQDVGSVTPGKGSSSTSAADASDAALGTSLPQTPAPTTASARAADDQADQGAPAQVMDAKAMTIVGLGVNYVLVPFTVKDSKGALVAGLTPRDVRIYENGLRQHLDAFSSDAFPLSVALVIDQSMPQDEMTRVDNALGAVQAAFTQYDQLAVFTYNNGPHMVTDFTGAQSARLVQAIDRSKGTGREVMMAGSLSGPLAQTTNINNQNFDPNTAPVRGHNGVDLNPPRDVHTLNDAILAAAVALSKTDPKRRRVIYVISDGKEYGSTAKPKDIVRYLQTNRISVYGTLVGDSALWGVGFLDRIHLPLMMRDNILPVYANATGGNFAAEFRTGEIEKSFAKIAEEVRTQYTIGYRTHEPFIDGKYRKLEVVIMNHGNKLQVLAKTGYYPSAMDARPAHTVAPQ